MAPKGYREQQGAKSAQDSAEVLTLEQRLHKAIDKAVEDATRREVEKYVNELPEGTTRPRFTNGAFYEQLEGLYHAIQEVPPTSPAHALMVWAYSKLQEAVQECEELAQHRNKLVTEILKQGLDQLRSGSQFQTHYRYQL